MDDELGRQAGMSGIQYSDPIHNSASLSSLARLARLTLTRRALYKIFPPVHFLLFHPPSVAWLPGGGSQMSMVARGSCKHGGRVPLLACLFFFFQLLDHASSCTEADFLNPNPFARKYRSELRSTFGIHHPLPRSAQADLVSPDQTTADQGRAGQGKEKLNNILRRHPQQLGGQGRRSVPKSSYPPTVVPSSPQPRKGGRASGT
jgi:hypothetical protein